MKTLKLFTRGGAELGVEVGELSRRKTAGSRRWARAERPLPLTAESSRGLRSRSAHAESDAAHSTFYLWSLFLPFWASMERRYFVDREVWIERVALKDHSDAAFTRGEIVDDLAADEDFADVGVSSQRSSARSVFFRSRRD